MIKLSAVIISYNEEKNIERCLRSLQGVADEIIVLDSFSADKTEEICRNYDVKFFQHPFDGHIQQKNRVISFAENDYVLSLDADEELSEELKSSISAFKENPDSDICYFNRLNIYCGKPIKNTSWYPDKKVRLWNKNKGQWAGVNPHDTVIANEGAKEKYLKGSLLHYSFNTIEEHIEQTNKFTTIAAEALFKAGKKAGICTVFLKTFGSFVKEFIFKTAFLSGFYGIVIGSINVFASFLKYSKLQKLIKDSK